MWFERGETLAAAVALLVLSLFAWRRSRRLGYAACLLTILFAGVLVAILHRPGRLPRIDAAPDETVVLDGCVVDPPAFADGRDQFTLELAPHARARVSLHLRDGENPPDLHYGQRIELDSRIRSIHNYRNPGDFDFSAWAAHRDIYWNAPMRSGAPVRVLPGECGNAFFHLVYGLRTAALNRIEQLYSGDAYATGMMRGILIGDSAKIEKIWTDDFRRTGTFHTLVVSGLHVSVLASFLVLLLRVCFVPEMPALMATSALTWLYAVISGWNAPAIRAAAALSLYVLARFLYRRGRVLNLLAAIAIVFLLLDPSQLFDASFQLTFLSVAAIGALAAPALERWLVPYALAVRDLAEVGKDPHLEPRQAAFRVELRLLSETFRLPLTALSLILRCVFYALESIVISTVVQVGVALPMAVYFHRISLSGLSANIFIVPLLALAMPIGFAAVFTGSHWIAAAAGLLLTASRHVAAWHVRFEPPWRIPDPPLWLSIASVAALLALAFCSVRAGSRPPRLRTLLSLSAVLVLFSLILIYPFAPIVHRGQVEMTAIDVGQGDSVLVTFPDGRLMLVDAGGFPSFGGKPRKSKIDTGEDVVSPYLWARHIRHLDIVVATHGHEDHIGGLPAVLDNFHPAELWTGAAPSGPALDALKAHARAVGVPVVAHHAGDRLNIGGAEISVLSPSADYVPADQPTNDDSLVLQIRYGRRTFLLEGDAEQPSELTMVDAGRLAHVDVLKAGHHGSRTSSTDPFLDVVHPAFAVISDGIDNLFHHPHPQTLERLAAHNARPLRTDQLGLISVRTDGRRMQIEDWADDMQFTPLAAPPRN